MSAARIMVCAAVALSTGALAGAREEAVAQAFTLVGEATQEAQDGSGACKRALRELGPLTELLAAQKKEATEQGLTRAQRQARALSAAARASCSATVARHVATPLDAAVGHLERAQEAKASVASVGTTLAQIAGGLGGLFSGPASSGGSTQHTQSSESTSTRRTEQINGKALDDQHEADDDADPAPSRRQARNSTPSRGAMKATCRNNRECESNTCFVGRGELGYCTKICDGFSDCPTGYDCKHVGNAPQKICQQDTW